MCAKATMGFENDKARDEEARDEKTFHFGACRLASIRGEEKC